MGFTYDDRISIGNLYISKGYDAKKHTTEFPDEGWALSSLNKLLTYSSILPVCFASFFLASPHTLLLKGFTVTDVMKSVHMSPYDERNTPVCCK